VVVVGGCSGWCLGGGEVGACTVYGDGEEGGGGVYRIRGGRRGVTCVSVCFFGVSAWGPAPGLVYPSS
jgi:hypothetical protein